MDVKKMEKSEQMHKQNDVHVENPLESIPKLLQQQR